MANIDNINKDGLFSMVKRITEENSSYVNKLPLKTGQFPKNILLPKPIRKQKDFSPKIKSPNIPSKKTITFKNKFLEKNNIQINKQNVLHLLSSKKKIKISEIKFFRNNNENNNSNISNYAKKMMAGKTVYINLEEDENKNLNIGKKNKVIKNSNSQHFEKSFNNNNSYNESYINKSLGKNLLLLKSPKLDMDSLIKNSKSFFKMFNNENINNNKNNNNINNNININININGNIENKKYENITETNLERRNIQYNSHNNSNDCTDKNLSYNIRNNNYNSNIIKKKHHKKFYLNKINNFEDEDEENNLIDNTSNKRKINNERNNTVNINVNFISNPKDNIIISRRITTNSNTNRLKLNEENNNVNNPDLRKSINISYIKSQKLRNFTKESYYPLRNKSHLHRNKIIKTSKTSIYEYNNDNFEEKNNNNNKIDIIQIEDLLILEGKFCHLIDCLKYDNPLPKMCAEWWNFYTYSSYFGKFPKLFPKIIKRNVISDYQIAHNSILIELLSIIIIYEILTEKYLTKHLINNLMEIINEIHLNFLIECDYILSKISNKSFNNLWIQKLRKVIASNRKYFNTNNNNHLSLLHQRNNLIQNKIQDLIYLCSDLISRNNNHNFDIDLDALSHFNNNIQNLPLMELNKYFNHVISKESLKMSKAFSYAIKRNNIISRKKYTDNLIIVPYLPKMQDKYKYTLVLDLDETLISFRTNEFKKSELKLRPGLFNFLRRVKSKYELIVFTAGMKEYAEPILDTIEKKEKFFLKRLYRQHTVYKDNIYIKDLTKLGRDLSKVIIVDNMPQNFCLQKENGILISNYFGQDNGDNTLNLLGDILLKIAQRPGRDVRNEIKKYKEEIFTKITTNLD